MLSKSSSHTISARSTAGSRLKEKGFSLVELMIASTVSLFLLAGLCTFYLKQKQWYLVEVELARLQDHGRLAVEILNQSIRQSGNIGCGKLTPDFPLHNSTQLAFGAENIITAQNLQVITVKRLSDERESLETPMLDRNHILLNHPAPFKIGDRLLIADCLQGDVMRVQNIETTSQGMLITADAPLSTLYQPHAEMGKLLVETFYLRPSSHKNKRGNAFNTLYVGGVDPRDQRPLVEGVQAMTITYALDKFHDGNVTQFVSAGEVPNWSWVSGVRIAMLLRSVEEVSDLGGNDKPLQQEWVTYIDVRSRDV